MGLRGRGPRRCELCDHWKQLSEDRYFGHCNRHPPGRQMGAEGATGMEEIKIDIEPHSAVTHFDHRCGEFSRYLCFDASCGGCLYWKETSRAAGVCCIRAPHVRHGFPETKISDWCGEHVDDTVAHDIEDDGEDYGDA